jgi:hypothetical protein
MVDALVAPVKIVVVLTYPISQKAISTRGRRPPDRRQATGVRGRGNLRTATVDLARSVNAAWRSLAYAAFPSGMSVIPKRCRAAGPSRSDNPSDRAGDEAKSSPSGVTLGEPCVGTTQAVGQRVTPKNCWSLASPSWPADKIERCTSSGRLTKRCLIDKPSRCVAPPIRGMGRH